MSDNSPDRLDRIEFHLAHLENQVEELNQVLIEQGRLVEAMRKQLRRQAETIENFELDRVKATSAKPPHH